MIRGMSGERYDAVVVGSGPNGLAPPLRLPATGIRSSCSKPPTRSAAARARRNSPSPASFTTSARPSIRWPSPRPFFNDLPLAEHGLEWIHPPLPLAHPLDDGTAAVLDRSVDVTADALGTDAKRISPADGPARRRVQVDFSANWSGHFASRATRFSPRRFGVARGAFRLEPGDALVRDEFRRGPSSRASPGTRSLPLEKKPSAAYRPHARRRRPRGRLADAAKVGRNGSPTPWPRSCASSAATFKTGPAGRVARRAAAVAAVLLDLTPRQILAHRRRSAAGSIQRRLSRYRYGIGIFKVDWALSGPIPWRGRLPPGRNRPPGRDAGGDRCRRARRVER